MAGAVASDTILCVLFTCQLPDISEKGTEKKGQIALTSLQNISKMYQLMQLIHLQETIFYLTLRESPEIPEYSIQITLYRRGTADIHIWI